MRWFGPELAIAEWYAGKLLFSPRFRGGPAVRTAPRNLAEKLALDEAKAGAGKRIMQGKIQDPKYPENLWAKIQHVHGDIVIHCWEDLKTGARHGFKFK